MKIAWYMSFIFAFMPFARAGVLIEPYVGFAKSLSGKATINGTGHEFDYTSPEYGGRLGMTWMGLMTGVDYSMESFKLHTKAPASVADAAVDAKDKVDKSQIGIFLGYRFPMIRFWGTYFLSSEVKGKDADRSPGSGSSDQFIRGQVKFKDGSGFGVGMGYSLFPFVSINGEYRKISYDTIIQSDGSKLDAAFYTGKISLSEFLLSVSFPISIF